MIVVTLSRVDTDEGQKLAVDFAGILLFVASPTEEGGYDVTPSAITAFEVCRNIPGYVSSQSVSVNNQQGIQILLDSPDRMGEAVDYLRETLPRRFGEIDFIVMI